MDLLKYYNLDYDQKMDMKIKNFLNSIRTADNYNNSDNAPHYKYRIVSLTPLRYAGGKSRAVGHILEVFPRNVKKRVISPFFGGGSFEFVLSKVLGFEVIGYDVFEILVNYWYYQINYPENLYLELAKLVPDKEHYTRIRHILLNYWEKVKPKSLVYKTKKKVPLTDAEKTLLDNDPLKRAAYYYYNHQLSYGPMFLGWASSVYLDQKRYNNIIMKVKNFKPGKVKVFCDSFENVIKKYPHDFLFCDPPYYLGDDSKMFKGIYPNSNFAIHHKEFDHKLLNELLKEHKGGFLLTYNNCTPVREMYKDYKQYFPVWQYSYGQGETRIGKNRIRSNRLNNLKESHEIIIVDPPHD
ncbi:MAG: DNA adenine methylase [Promethearchaeota archaeon]